MQARSDLQNAQSAAAGNANFQAQVAAGKNAMQAQRYKDAVTAFTAAQQLNPNDPTVPTLLQQADSLTNLQTALTQFRTALAASDLTGATTAYNTAAGLAPNDPAVVKAGADLKNAQSAAAGNANFQAQVTAGKNAMQAQRYKDAVTAFTAAQQLNPNDPTVPPLLQQAQTALANLQTALTKFRTALAASDLTGASNAYNAAAGLAPNDPAVVQAGVDLQKAQGSATANANFQAKVKAGNDAMQAKRYSDAVAAFTAAQQLNPNDLMVPPLLQQCSTALTNLQTALTKFRTALAASDLTGASNAYNAAAVLAPNDPAVVQAGADLQKAQGSATANANFQAKVKAGNDAMQAKALQRRGDSLHCCATVEPERSDGATAPQARQTALTNLQTALTQFRTALAAGNLAGATTAYNTAAGLAPNDPAVVQAGADLQKAKCRPSARSI